MKIKKTHTFISINIAIVISIICCGCFAQPEKDQKILNDAQLLYSKINEFLKDNKDCDPKNFEEICRKYILDNSSSPTILNKEEFDKQSQGKLLLYRGLHGDESNDVKKYADEFKFGIIYIGKNINNVRGNGIYTTANPETAKLFDHKNDNEDGAVVTMFLNNDKKILDNTYLEELKNIIVENHSDEFKYIADGAKMDFSFDPLHNLTIEYMFKEFIPDFDVSKLEGLNSKGIEKLAEETGLTKMTEGLDEESSMMKIYEKMQKDPRFEELSKNKYEQYFTDNKAALFYNSRVINKASWL